MSVRMHVTVRNTEKVCEILRCLPDYGLPFPSGVIVDGPCDDDGDRLELAVMNQKHFDELLAKSEFAIPADAKGFVKHCEHVKAAKLHFDELQLYRQLRIAITGPAGLTAFVHIAGLELKCDLFPAENTRETFLAKYLDPIIARMEAEFVRSCRREPPIEEEAPDVG